MVISPTSFSRLPKVIKLDFENGKIVWMFSNVVQNVDLPLVRRCKLQRCNTQRCFNVNLTLFLVTPLYQPKDNVETTFKCLLGCN